MPLIAFKVLGRDGSGSLDNVYRGYAELAARQARGDKVVAINLSLGSPVMDAEGLAVECDWVKRLAKYGTTIVAAAGNDGGELLTNTMPAACPDTLSVTSIASDDSPSYFSNLADASSPAFIREKTVTAPGSNIFSTFNNGGYSTLSGTSMATPHATGVVLACYLNGACKLGSPSTTGVIPKVQAAAKAQGCAAGARCGPSWGSDKFYGNAISVRTW
jgi:subtilisin family serine protease